MCVRFYSSNAFQQDYNGDILTMADVFLQHRCDLINMSYGESTLLPDYGRFVDLVNEVSILNYVNSLGWLFLCILFLCVVFHPL